MEDAARRRALALSLAWLAAFAFALWYNWQWLVLEYQHAIPWLAPLLWFSEAAGLVAFLRSVAWLAGVGAPPAPSFIVWVLFTAGIDAAAGLTHLGYENQSRERAILTPAAVVGGEYRAGLFGGARCRILVRYNDADGRPRNASIIAFEKHFPAPVLDAVKAGRLPAPCAVLRDRDRPGRVWVAGASHGDRLDLAAWSLIVTWFTVIALIFECYDRLSRTGQTLPVQTVPFLVGSGLLMLQVLMANLRL